MLKQQSKRFLPLDKGHVPENLWKLSVTYLFEDTLMYCHPPGESSPANMMPFASAALIE